MLPLAILPVVAAQAALRDRSRTWTALLWATTLFGAAVGSVLGWTSQPDPLGSLGVVPQNDAEKPRPEGRGGLGVVPQNDAEKAWLARHAGLSAPYATWVARLAPAFLGILAVTTSFARNASRWRAWAHASSLVVSRSMERFSCSRS